jgi:hypothetical protein
MRPHLIPGAVLLFAGCWSSVLDEATQSHVDPAGKVQAALTGGTPRTTTALAHAKSEPMVVEGASTELTFSLTAADSAGGGTALGDLKMPGNTTQITVRPGGRNRLEIHLDGGGCVATSGSVQLSLDGNGHLQGGFDADGMVSGGSSSCHMTGTLADVPVDR